MEVEQYHIEFDINPKTWFFPTQLSALEIFIISLAKMVVYEAQLKEVQPNIAHLKNKIKWKVELERHIARLSNKQELFETKWGPLKDIHMQEN